MCITTTGNVGIGTTSPLATLDVNGNIKSRGNLYLAPGTLETNTKVGANDTFLIMNHSTYSGNLGPNYPLPECGTIMTNRSGTGTFPWLMYTGIVKDVATTNAGESLRMDFGAGSSTATNLENPTMNPLMTLRFNGNVGIGMTNPQQKLEVNGNILLGSGQTKSFIHGDQDTALSSDTNILIVSDANDTEGATSGDIIFGSGSAINMDTNRDFTFAEAYPSNVPRLEYMRILGSNGNVGIGTTSPTEALQVYKDGSDPTYIHVVGKTSDRAGIIFSEETADKNVIMEYDGTGAGDGNYLAFYSAVSGWTAKGAGLNFVPANGRVGIGTTSPKTALHVIRPDDEEAVVRASGTSQGTGRFLCSQSNGATSFNGGGIEYNGDNSPGYSGAGADYNTLFRASGGTAYWTARNVYNGNQWEFRSSINNSDDRVKENETYIRDATDTLMKIKPQLYDKKPSIESTDTKEWFCESGLIAQELYYDVPELRHLVKIPRDARDINANVSITSADPTIDPEYSAWGKDTSAVNYVGLVPYLIKSVQEITTELPRHKTPVSNITPRNVNDFVGLIVSKRGSVELSSKSEDKACYGVISETTCDTQNNEILVNSSGEGKIWVTNVNGNLEAGDLITTSNIAGYGELQNSPVLSNFTVAKLTEDYDFNPSSIPIRRIRQEMSNVTVYSVTREVRVTEEEYNELAEEDRTIENRITYFDGDNQIDEEKYSNLASDTLRTETNEVFKLIHRHTSKTMREGYTPEVRQELVNVLDEHGQIQWEDHPTETEKAYKIRYLDASGVITDEANAVHTAAFVGCTYHCG